jgi:hypothetical protein
MLFGRTLARCELQPPTAGDCVAWPLSARGVADWQQ